MLLKRNFVSCMDHIFHYSLWSFQYRLLPLIITFRFFVFSFISAYLILYKMLNLWCSIGWCQFFSFSQYYNSVSGIFVAYSAPTRHGCLKVVENNYCASKRGIPSFIHIYFSPDDEKNSLAVVCYFFYELNRSCFIG